MDHDDVEAIMHLVSEDLAKRMVAEQLAALAEELQWPSVPPEGDG